MKKIAVAAMGREVAGHFGHCENFNIFDVENNEIVNAVQVANPGHRPGFLPNFLHDLGVNVIISGGMGGGAVEIFNSHNIQIVVGAEGDSEDAVERFLKGELVSTGSVCNKHEHEHECGSHHHE